MATVDNNIQIDEAAVQDMLNSPTGLVAPMLQELAESAAAVARTQVQVRHTPTWTLGSDAQPPGYTKTRIDPAVGWDANGHIYGTVRAPADPAIFLEDPAEQIAEKGHEFPFLTTGLWSLEGQV